MTRRIVRASMQLGVFATIILFLVFFLDTRYRVLPQSIHSHLPLHHEGLVITDITVQTCSSLNPLGSCKLDPSEWHRIEKDLYLDTGWVSAAYVHIKRKREEELKEDDRVIEDVRIGRLDPAMGEKDQAAHRWEARPAGVWLKRTAKRHAADSTNVVTAVDVLFGADAVEPRPGWEIKDNALQLDTAGEVHEARLTIRRGSPKGFSKPVPRIGKDGKFKIMQVSDLHLSTGLGVCRDANPKTKEFAKCDADPRTLEFVAKVIVDEKPDMVVLSGDIVNGETAPDAQTALFKIAELLAKHHIPYATIWGNHDDTGSLPRDALMSLIESLPFSLAQSGSNTIEGIGNYYVEVLAHGNNKHSALTLYFLDTHSGSPDERLYPGYDWLKPKQIQWFKDTAQTLKKSNQHKAYTHIHLDMAFIHIPLPEYMDQKNEIVGKWGETPMAPRFNTHFKDALVEEGVKAVSAGHDHVNDYCALAKNDKSGDPELWMCYAGGSGFGGYGRDEWYHRRIRVFEVDANEARISTWKRVEYGETEKRLDDQVIVDSGRVIAP
ncbi:Metallo-dependent phosphatase [Mytilinidion resinicola]|uniref:Metallo-dependent phosphatase n=1 Tax=Mytilinidion resinicola TaxID=574789 RepID=A0A6A6Z2K1_9PEZI|nr:Metallo-dependent phosphatase [Mytilinidion resinicola]KAF2814524.1 Metallo-dependent phosphatase [Mytilinidion resinicola]